MEFNPDFLIDTKVTSLLWALISQIVNVSQIFSGS